MHIFMCSPCVGGEWGRICTWCRPNHCFLTVPALRCGLAASESEHFAASNGFVRHLQSMGLLSDRTWQSDLPEALQSGRAELGPRVRHITWARGRKGSREWATMSLGKLAKEDEDLTNDAGPAGLQTMRGKHSGRYDFMHHISDKILEALWTNYCIEIGLLVMVQTGRNYKYLFSVPEKKQEEISVLNRMVKYSSILSPQGAHWKAVSWNFQVTRNLSRLGWGSCLSRTDLYLIQEYQGDSVARVALLGREDEPSSHTPSDMMSALFN